MVRQLVERADARIDQLGALRNPHARDQQQVVGRTHLLLADRAPEACPDVFVLPAHRDAGGVVVVEQLLQSRPLLAVHRNQLIDAVIDRGAVAEHQLGLLVYRNAGLAQRVGVGRDLKQRGHLRRAGQLGVGHLVLPVAADQEVGEPDEATVEHRRLVDHRRAALDGPRSLVSRGGDVLDGERDGTADDGNVAVLVAQLVEPALFVLVAERCGALEQFVRDADALTPAEFRVEFAQQGIFTARGGCQIRCAVDDAVACHEHSSHCRRLCRHQPPALAISSTPLPFQRNFTTLGNPIPPE